MKIQRIKFELILLLFAGLFTLAISGCGENPTTEGNQSDNEYLLELISQGLHSSYQNDEDLMTHESNDLDDSGAVGNDNYDNTIDSLYKWGRKVIDVNVNLNIADDGDSLKKVNITRTINGNFIIIANVNGVLDTIVKPYTEVIKRYAVFKRISHSNRPRYNWQLCKISIADGQTTAPQTGTDFVEINKVEVYVGNVLKYIFTGPDFTQNIFRTRNYDSQIPLVNTGDQVKIKVYTFSKQSDNDIVSWHWAKNDQGLHRLPFVMISSTPGGSGWNRVYERTFTIYNNHIIGRFNGFISAATRKSLFDDSPSEFATDLVGIPYAVAP
ncbi:MAG: hypothetical protein EHM58_05950 [Ignavibacteriae bacterium]|nr:MAG: hypothetical protein EHM58_05950 [Ignavibacteriota bacterium]